jgi:hypothetical protein
VNSKAIRRQSYFSIYLSHFTRYRKGTPLTPYFNDKTYRCGHGLAAMAIFLSCYKPYKMIQQFKKEALMIPDI